MKKTNLILICVLALVYSANLHKKTTFSKTDSEKASQRQLQDTEPNYIVVYFATKCSYGENGFASSITARSEYVDNIAIGGETKGINQAFEISAGTEVTINFI